MEYTLFTVLMVMMILVLFSAQISIYRNKYNNLKGIKNALNHGKDAKMFYMSYMGIYQAGDQPHITVALDDVVSDKPISFKPDGQVDPITFNIGPLAVKKLNCEVSHLTFLAKFNGEITALTVPLKNIKLIVGVKSGVAFEKK